MFVTLPHQSLNCATWYTAVKEILFCSGDDIFSFSINIQSRIPPDASVCMGDDNYRVRWLAFHWRLVWHRVSPVRHNSRAKVLRRLTRRRTPRTLKFAFLFSSSSFFFFWKTELQQPKDWGKISENWDKQEEEEEEDADGGGGGEIGSVAHRDMRIFLAGQNCQTYILEHEAAAP